MTFFFVNFSFGGGEKNTWTPKPPLLYKITFWLTLTSPIVMQNRFMPMFP